MRKWFNEFSIPFGILSGAFGIFSAMYSTSFKISLGWLFVLSLIPWCFTYVLYCLLCDERKAEKIVLPRVLRAIETGYGVKEPTLLAEKSQLLGQGIAVSIYTTRDGFELLLGQGGVKVIQGDGLAQIAVLQMEEGHEDAWKGIYANSSDMLKLTLVRPGQQIEM